MTESAHRRTVVINAPVEKVWATLADLGDVSSWIPTVKTSEVTSPQADGVTSTRVCTLSPMGTISEEVAAWEPNKRLVIDIVDFKAMPMMRSSRAEFLLEVISDSQTRVTISMGYVVGMGIVGATMDKVMLTGQMQTGLEGMAAGLKKYVETGEPSNTAKSDLPREAVSIPQGR